MRSKFLRGFIDGALSTLGIVVGALAASSSVILAAAIGGTLANGISNVLSAFSAAGAEDYTELRQVEKAMVDKELKGGMLDRQISKQTTLKASVDGVATIIGGAIPILPYLFMVPDKAVFVSVGLVIFVIFIIGMYLGKLSRRNILFSALKMSFFAASVAAVVYLIQSIIVPVP